MPKQRGFRIFCQTIARMTVFSQSSRAQSRDPVEVALKSAPRDVSTSLDMTTRFRVPLHPWTTLLFIAAELCVVVSTFVHDPTRSFIGLAIAIAGLPAYFLWRAKRRGEA